MTFQMIHSTDGGNARSPFRIIEQSTGHEVDWINRFLDRECVCRLAKNTLRSYAMDLLHFLRWWASLNDSDAITEGALSATVLLDYLRFQAGHHPQPAAATTNRRVGVVERALRNEFPDTPSPFAPRFHNFYRRRLPLGYGRPRPAQSRLRVKEPKRIVMPLSVDEGGPLLVQFPHLARLGHRRSDAVARTPLQRSHHLKLRRCLTGRVADSVRGKGNTIRCLPLASDTVLLLDHYLRLERPQSCGPALFVSLKGSARGVRMTPAGMRSLFRHHRRATGIAAAHPHRFRHYAEFRTMPSTS